jgi:hypothetical protein
MRMTCVTALSIALLPLAACAPLEAFVDDIAASGVFGDTSRTPPPPGGARGDRSPDAPPLPIFGDWWYLTHPTMRSTTPPRSGDPCNVVPGFAYRDVNTYVPVNSPGGATGGPSFVPGEWFDWYARCFTEKIAQSGAPVAMLIRPRNAPFPYGSDGAETSPGEVRAMLDAVPRLDYLLMDLEPVNGGTDRDIVRNVEEIVRLVRSHPNPRVSGAFIGNYNDWPGPSDEGRIRPDKRDRLRVGGRWDRDRFYRENFNVAMPIAYPYQTFSRHSDAQIQKGPVTPNDRAAIFWAPIARVSVAARNLPDGHLLIPWVSNFVDHEPGGQAYHAPPPPREDLEAIIRHIRLRGAHSFMVWTSDDGRTDHPTIDYTQYKQLAMNAWKTLDPAFPEGGSPLFLNFEDDKSTGLVWSGVVSEGTAWILVSNLGPRAGSVALPPLPGVPERSPEVPTGQHRLFRWTIGS